MTVEIACRVYELEPPVLTARPSLPPKARKKEGRGRKRDEEEGGTWRKERRGGRSDEESEEMKNEKVA